MTRALLAVQMPHKRGIARRAARSLI
jgi:hypothetical protein